jgi:hypothetical protein
MPSADKSRSPVRITKRQLRRMVKEGLSEMARPRLKWSVRASRVYDEWNKIHWEFRHGPSADPEIGALTAKALVALLDATEELEKRGL